MSFRFYEDTSDPDHLYVPNEQLKAKQLDQLHRLKALPDIGDTGAGDPWH